GAGGASGWGGSLTRFGGRAALQQPTRGADPGPHRPGRGRVGPAQEEWWRALVTVASRGSSVFSRRQSPVSMPRFSRLRSNGTVAYGTTAVATAPTICSGRHRWFTPTRPAVKA